MTDEAQKTIDALNTAIEQKSVIRDQLIEEIAELNNMRDRLIRSLEDEARLMQTRAAILGEIAHVFALEDIQNQDSETVQIDDSRDIANKILAAMRQEPRPQQVTSDTDVAEDLPDIVAQLAINAANGDGEKPRRKKSTEPKPWRVNNTNRMLISSFLKSLPSTREELAQQVFGDSWRKDGKLKWSVKGRFEMLPVEKVMSEDKLWEGLAVKLGEIREYAQHKTLPKQSTESSELLMFSELWQLYSEDQLRQSLTSLGVDVAQVFS